MLLYLKCYKHLLSKGVIILLGQPVCNEIEENNYDLGHELSWQLCEIAGAIMCW